MGFGLTKYRRFIFQMRKKVIKASSRVLFFSFSTSSRPSLLQIGLDLLWLFVY